MPNTGKSGPRIAVDVGNSSIKLGMMDPGNEKLRTARIALSSGDWSEAVEQFIGLVIQPNAGVTWMVASVNSVAATTLESWIAKHRAGDSIVRVGRADLGIQVGVRQPDAVGIDRLLAASLAYRMADDSAAIVIDAGTTITIDLVDASGTFCGGAILPGLGLQFAALHEATDRLPRLEPMDILTHLESPGRDTAAAMHLGVAGGVLGAIDRISAGYDLPEAPLYITGGDAERLSPAIARPHQTVADLPLLALYELEIDSEACLVKGESR